MNSIARSRAAKLRGLLPEQAGMNTRQAGTATTPGPHGTRRQEWKFQKDVSIAGAGQRKVRAGDADPYLRGHGNPAGAYPAATARRAKSDAGRGCGVHIHIGAKGHTPQSLRNLANIMAGHESLIADALNLDRWRMNRYCRTVDPRFWSRSTRRNLPRWRPCGHLVHKPRRKLRQGQHYNDSRYHMLNYHATFTKGTVSSGSSNSTSRATGAGRSTQGSSKLHPALPRTQPDGEGSKDASPKPQQNENPKYAMRTWLLRLGFIGDEFKTARDILTRGLQGDASFRNGRAA